MIDSIGKILLRHRLMVLMVILLLSAIFAYGMGKIQFYTSFADLLPPNHPYIKIYNKHKKTFGGANVIAVAIERKEGTIYDLETLAKIKKITDFFEITPGVNQYQILSIARSKVKDVKSTSWGLEAKPVMWPTIPQTIEEVRKLRENIYSNSSIYGHLVSYDDKAALIIAELYEGKIDYDELFKKVKPFLDSLCDEDTTIYVAGTPILHGWLYHHMKDIINLFIISAVAMIFVLLVFTRSLVGLIVPLVSTLFSAIWGFGFAGFLGYHFDPLMLVIPFLISARTISHSVQVCARWMEEYKVSQNTKVSAEKTFCGLFKPGSVSILTDAGGVLIIAIAPIPVLTNIAYMGSFWILSNIVTVFLLNPLILSFLPRYKIAKNGDQKKGALEKFLFWFSSLYGRRLARWVLFTPFVVVALWSVYWVPQLKMGDVHTGSAILWPDSFYNQSAAHINNKFPGLDQLMVYIIGEGRDILKNPVNLRAMESFADEIVKLDKVGGSSSIVSLVKKVNMVLHYDHPFWNFIPKDQDKIADLYEMAMSSGEPGDFDRWLDYDKKRANVLFYLKDHKGDTITSVIKEIEDVIKTTKLEKAEFKLAGGYVGTLAAANEVIARSHELNLMAVLSFTFLCCSFAYRSFFAGFLFIISLVLANFFTLSIMAFSNMGLNINTIPVVSIGIGLGVDYGLYVVSRIVESYKKSGDLTNAVATGVSTSGRAVLVTALTMIAGIILWYFSPIKFQAEMSLLLTIVLTMNLLGGMILLPILIHFAKPRFITGKLSKTS